MMYRVIAPVAVAATILVTPFAAQAGQTGMASMHEQRVAGGRLCFTDHAHVGTGSWAASKREATVSAARDWSAFTGFEYGSDWARWRFAREKTVSCQKSGSGYLCEVVAKPCLAQRVRSATR
jgi:hypothetical protein